MLNTQLDSRNYYSVNLQIVKNNKASILPILIPIRLKKSRIESGYVEDIAKLYFDSMSSGTYLRLRNPISCSTNYFYYIQINNYDSLQLLANHFFSKSNMLKTLSVAGKDKQYISEVKMNNCNITVVLISKSSISHEFYYIYLIFDLESKLIFEIRGHELNIDEQILWNEAEHILETIYPIDQ